MQCLWFVLAKESTLLPRAIQRAQSLSIETVFSFRWREEYLIGRNVKDKGNNAAPRVDRIGSTDHRCRKTQHQQRDRETRHLIKRIFEFYCFERTPNKRRVLRPLFSTKEAAKRVESNLQMPNPIAAASKLSSFSKYEVFTWGSWGSWKEIDFLEDFLSVVKNGRLAGRLLKDDKGKGDVESFPIALIENRCLRFSISIDDRKHFTRFGVDNRV